MLRILGGQSFPTSCWAAQGKPNPKINPTPGFYFGYIAETFQGGSHRALFWVFYDPRHKNFHCFFSRFHIAENTKFFLFSASLHL